MAKLKKEVAVIEEAVFVKTDETRFYELEGIVAKGLSTFIQVGKALMELRDGKSYKAVGYETFEDLCERGFGIGKRAAYYAIESSSLAQKMCTIVHIPNEGTARELLTIKDETLQLAVAKRAQEMAGDNAITSASVKAAKAEIIGTKAKSEKAVKAEVINPDKWPEDTQLVAVRTFALCDELVKSIAEKDGVDIATGSAVELLAIVMKAYFQKSGK